MTLTTPGVPRTPGAAEVPGAAAAPGRPAPGASGASGASGLPRAAGVPDVPGAVGTPRTSGAPVPHVPGAAHAADSRTPEPGSSTAGGERPAGRPARVIRTEATTEIPVHLLFRDGSGPSPQRQRSAVVGRGQGAGEPPGPWRPAATPARPSAPQADPELVERPARVLPGGVGALAGLCGAAGGVATSWWAGVLPTPAASVLGFPVQVGASGPGPAQWVAYVAAGALGLFGFGGLTRGRTGRAWVLGLFGRYRGTVRRTGLLWVNPLLLRHRVDVRLRHWRSEPMQAADRGGMALRASVLVVWRVRDTARATLGVEDHEAYVRQCVEAALLRVPMEVPGETGGVADTARGALTRLVAADAEPVGVEVLAVRPVRVEYAPEVAAAMNRRRIAALDARHRASVLTSVVDSVEDTVTRLTLRGLVELDDHERKVLVKDLTVAFCSGRGDPGR